MCEEGDLCQGLFPHLEGLSCLLCPGYGLGSGLVSSWLQGWRRSAACGVKINQPQKLTELTVGGRKRKITDNRHFFLQRADAITVDEVA